MTAAAPDVSVIVAAWRAEAYIAAAVRSALDQTGVSVEVIVIDDQSPDATLARARAAAPDDPRLVLRRLPENGGPSVARNAGLDLARGRFVAVLDADDTMAPERLARLVSLAETTGADLVADNLLATIPGPVGPVPRGPFYRSDQLMRSDPVTLAAYLDPRVQRRLGGNLGYMKPLVRRESLNRLGTRYDPSLRNSEDFHLVADLLAQGAVFRLMPDALYRYTVHAGSTSHRISVEAVTAILQADAALLARRADAFGPAERAALQRRRAGLERLRLETAFADRVKAGRPLSGLAALAGQPTHAPGVLVHFAGVALGRLAGRTPAASAKPTESLADG